MKTRSFFLFFLCLLHAITVKSQNGPAGIGDRTGTSILKMWYDASDLDGDGVAEGLSESGLSGSLVQIWTDKSGYSRTAYANYTGITTITNSCRPTYTLAGLNNYPYLVYSAGNALTVAAIARDSTETIFAVHTATGTGISTYYDASIGNIRRLYSNTATSIHVRTATSGGGVTNSGVAFGNPVISRALFLATGLAGAAGFYSALQVNGNTTVNSPSSTFISVNGIVSIGWVPTPVSLSGNLSELIIYKGNINRAQRMIMFNYLSAKYGITLLGYDLYVIRI